METFWIIIVVGFLLYVLFSIFAAGSVTKGKPELVEDLPEGTVFRIVDVPETTKFVFFVKNGKSHVLLVQFPEKAAMEPGQEFIVTGRFGKRRPVALPTKA